MTPEACALSCGGGGGGRGHPACQGPKPRSSPVRIRARPSAGPGIPRGSAGLSPIPEPVWLRSAGDRCQHDMAPLLRIFYQLKEVAPGQGLQGSRAGGTQQQPGPGGPSKGKKVICQADGGHDVRSSSHGRRRLWRMMDGGNVFTPGPRASELGAESRLRSGRTKYTSTWKLTL